MNTTETFVWILFLMLFQKFFFFNESLLDWLLFVRLSILAFSPMEHVSDLIRKINERSSIYLFMTV